MKFKGRVLRHHGESSHPSRGAWIEIQKTPFILEVPAGRTPHGVRGLKYRRWCICPEPARSHPSRGAWIEMR